MPHHFAAHVEITTHAHGRWRERAPGQDEPGARQIMARLNNMLKLGAPLDERCQLWVRVNERLSAICQPQFDGCWRCVTYKFHGNWERFNREVAK